MLLGAIGVFLGCSLGFLVALELLLVGFWGALGCSWDAIGVPLGFFVGALGVLLGTLVVLSWWVGGLVVVNACVGIL